METLLVAVGGFLLFLIGLVVLRVKTGPRFEIKNSDIVLALVPIGLWMLLTGKVQEFGFGDFKVVAAAFQEASATQVSLQVTRLPVETVKTNEKTDVLAIPSLLRDSTRALSFRLGHGGYWGPAIQDYLERLPRLRYIVINDAGGTFFGALDAQIITNLLSRPPKHLGATGQTFADNFASGLNESDTRTIARMPTFMSAQRAIMATTDKSEALRKMDSLDVHTLPVVDASGAFIGVVDRAKLTSSMLIEISERLAQGS